MSQITVTNPTQVDIRVAGPAGAVIPVTAGQTLQVPAYMEEACIKAMLTVKAEAEAEAEAPKVATDKKTKK